MWASMVRALGLSSCGLQALERRGTGLVDLKQVESF